MTFKFWNTESEVVTGSGLDRETVASLPNGGYVVAWRNNEKIYFQIYDGAGRKAFETPKLLVEDTRLHNIADIEVNPVDGTFAIAWNSSVRGDASSFSFSTRVFDIKGNPITPANPPLVSNISIDNGDAPAMARNGNDGYVTVFQSGASSVKLVVQNNRGEAVQGGVYDVVPNLAGVDNVDVAELGGGKFLVSYAASGTVYTKLITLGQQVPENGTPIGNGGSDAEVVALKNAQGELTGAYCVTFRNGGTVQTHVYNASGVYQNTYTIDTQVLALDDAFQTVALTGGRIAVLYNSAVGSPTSPTDNGDIFLKIIDPSLPPSNPGSIVTYPTAINARAAVDGFGPQYTPTLTEMKDGRLALAWHDPSMGGGVGAAISTVIFDPRTAPVTVEGSVYGQTMDLGHDDYYVGTELGGDILRGRIGNDTLLGGDGNDHLNGGVGADSLIGGNGQDTASYWDSDVGVGVYLWDPSKNTGDAKGDTYTTIEVIAGSEDKDTGDTIEGAIGNDIFYGGQGNDLLKGFGGNDTLQGAEGADTLYGGAGNDYFDGGWDSGVFGSERDRVTYEYSTAGVGVVANLDDVTKNTGEAAGDSYIGIDDLAGTQWDDILVGLHGDRLRATQHNQLYGREGNDTLVGGWGNDTLDGGEGFNFASYITAEVGVKAYLDDRQSNTGEARGDVYVARGDEATIRGLIGSNHDDTLHGSNEDGDTGHNELRGGGGNDELSGLNGDDTLDGGAGGDKLLGGNGYDLASYATSTTGVAVDLRTGGAGDAAGDTFDSIEGLIGSATGGDVLTGNDSGNVLSGLGGNDLLVGGKGADALWGGAGIDTISYAGAAGAVTVNLATGKGGGSDAEGDTYSSIENAVGSNFNDTFYGNDAANTFQGGLGDDTYHVGAGDAVVEAAGGGNDKVVTNASFTLGAEVEVLEGTGSGALVLTGNGLNNTIVGNAAGNWIDGGVGADTMMGGAGDDTYVIDNAGDRIFDDVGANTVVLTVNYDLSLLPASVTRVTVAEGLPLNLTGTNGANVLMGNAAVNTLRGLGGNDTIYGKAGNDKLYGGTGRDTFIFDTRPNKSTNVDKIYDFKARDDSFWLDNAVFTKLGRAGSEARPVKFKSDMFVTGTRAQDREDRIVYDKKTGNLYYDADGTGRTAQVKIATLVNKTTLKFDDFFVI
ncbi:calcium-binding protein [Microvirga arsenatis]|uniref:Ca2+-binding protein, RTX toxin-related n=1 Tax=Microvirga arsenatis TaxID=2692265 RepID=A0ABW9YVB2_9HYPH|nr:calcium-binding protein [Microvirga arsenatis]NBJ09550.1 hypothetical protein [Microvirga arsenatis]NBJ23591.1 hypothetical protein [Microvirga arsenatis]